MAPGAKPRYDTLKKFHEEQTAVIVRNTEGALKDRFPTERPTVKGCEKMIGAISDGSMDFAKKAEFYETLQNINTEITALGAK